MSLYPLYLKVKTAIRKVPVQLHLTHPPHLLDHSVTGLPLKGVGAKYHAIPDGSPSDLPIIRAGVESSAQLSTVLFSGAKTIALIEGLSGGLVENISTYAGSAPANLLAVELGNEIDLTGHSAKEFGVWLENSYTTLRASGFHGDIITGGVSRVRPDTLAWLAEALSWVTQDVLVGIHRYSTNNDATIPQAGYINREEECNAILKVASGRGIAVTEFGYSLLDGYSEPEYLKVRNSIRADFEYFRLMGVKYATIYQWMYGLTNTQIDRYGLLRPDGAVINLDLIRS